MGAGMAMGMGGNPAAAAGAGQAGNPQGTLVTSGDKPDANADTNATPSSTQGDSGDKDDSKDSNGFGKQVYGGGPIVGVASTSKETSIREFNHKNHYNQWQFIYDPTTDRGGTINTPYEPPLQIANQNLQQQGTSGTTGQPGNPAPGFGVPAQATPQPTNPSPTPDQSAPQQ